MGPRYVWLAILFWTVMLLSHLSVDIISDIFRYVTLQELQKLLFTGSPAIVRVVFGITCVNLVSDGVAPLFLPNLTRLTRLRSFFAHFTFFGSILRASKSFRLEKLPSSLTHLSLDFQNAPSLLKDLTPGVALSQYIKLNHMFPSLVELAVIGVWSEIHHDLFVNLPRSLRSLTFRQFPPSSVLLSDAHLIFWPPTLEHLNAPIIRMAPLKGRLPRFPDSLTFLRITCALEDFGPIQTNLPPQLRLLDLRTDDRAIPGTGDMSRNWHLLPRTLTTLFTHGEDLIPSYLDQLPENLLSLQLVGATIELDCAKRFPRGLTSLEMDAWKKDEDSAKIVLNLPRTLKEFPPAWTERIAMSIEAKSKDLTNLELSTSALQEMLSILPSSLTNFDARDYADFGLTEARIIASLPSRNELKTYLGTCLSQDVIQQLPRSLEQLECGENIPHLGYTMRYVKHRAAKAIIEARRKAADEISLTPHDVSLLPRMISKLFVEGSIFESAEALTQLPRSLVHFTWDMKNAKRFSCELLSFLPKTLMFFMWTIDGVLVTNEWLLPLEECDNLTALSITSPSLQTQLTSEHLLHLPKNLITYVTNISSVLHEDHLCNIRPWASLKVLDISCPTFCGITNNGVAKLPRNLFSLTLPTCPYLTAWSLTDFPKELVTLRCGSVAPSWWQRSPTSS